MINVTKTLDDLNSEGNHWILLETTSDMWHDLKCDLGKKYPNTNAKGALESQEIRGREKLLDD